MYKKFTNPINTKVAKPMPIMKATKYINLFSA